METFYIYFALYLLAENKNPKILWKKNVKIYKFLLKTSKLNHHLILENWKMMEQVMAKIFKYNYKRRRIMKAIEQILKKNQKLKDKKSRKMFKSYRGKLISR